MERTQSPNRSAPAKAQTTQEETGPQAVPHLLHRLTEMARGEETITIKRLTKEIGAQGHAPLLMIVAVLMILPTGMIPGIGGALGTLAAIIGLQMLLGRRGIWLPAFLGRREISASRIRSVSKSIRPAAEWIRRHLHPRWETLASGDISLSIIAVVLILLGGSLLVLGAIPVAAPLLGVPIAFFALGILVRDGLVVAAGYVLIFLSLAGMWLLQSNAG
jgi:hypothetical protein